MNTLVSFRCQEGWGSEVHASNRHFLSPSGLLLTGEGLCHVDFQGPPEEVQNWFVGSADISNALQAYFALTTVLASEIGKTRKSVERKRLLLDSLIYLPASHPMSFLGRCSSVKISRTTVLSMEVLILLLFVVTAPRWSCADNFGVLARGENCTNVHLARQVEGKPVSMCTTYPLPADAQIFSVMKCHQPARIAVERTNG